MLGRDGNAASVGYGITGVAAPAVSLGSIEAWVTAETTLSAAAYADVAGASIDLAAGTWLMMAAVHGRSVNALALMHAAITDGPNNVVAEGSDTIPASGAASVNAHGSVPLFVLVTPAATTTYKLRGARGNTTVTASWTAMDGSGQGVANNASSNTDKGTGIRAIRLA